MTFRRPNNLILVALVVLLAFAFFLSRVSRVVTDGTLVFASRGAMPAQKLQKDIENTTLGFEKIFVVGLPQRSDRRDSMVLAAALSNVEIEFIDGISGESVPNSAIPVAEDQGRIPEPNIGSWRAHLNAIREVVRRNLTSALILEDDADWDIRVRTQLRAFALSSQALTQPLSRTRQQYADPTYPGGSNKQASRPSDISYSQLPETDEPMYSPYGDNWDALWLGHCGMHFPFEENTVIPKGRVVQTDTDTVPQQQYLWTLAYPDDLKEQYPNHTRVVHHVQDGICSLGYAVSQKGARKMLYELGLKNLNAAFDILLRWYCEGEGGRDYHNCLTSQPGLFHHHRRAGPKSSNSDIADHGEGFQKEPHTDMVRWSVRMNAASLMAGKPPVDQFPNTE